MESKFWKTNLKWEIKRKWEIHHKEGKWPSWSEAYGFIVWQKANDEILDSRWWLVFFWNSHNFHPWVNHLRAPSIAL